MGEESSSTISTLSSDQSNDAIELDIQIFIELKQSQNSNDLGAYSRIKINADQFIGNYKGKHRKSMAQCIDPNYVWTILSSRQIPLFYIDATDPSDSNWLRFVRSTPDPNKYNVICMQQNQQINYFTYKEINEGDELLTYLPGKKKKPKNKPHLNVSYKLYEESKIIEPEPESINEIEEQIEEVVELEKVVEDEDEIEFKISSDEIRKKEDYFFQFNFSLKLKNQKKSLKRQLVKCDLCSYTIIVDTNFDYDKIIKSHIIDQHLKLAQETATVEEGVEEIIDTLIKQIENPIDSENTFNFYFNFNDSNKNKFDLLNFDLKCVYCDYEVIDEEHNDYLNHLTKVHKSQILNDQLTFDSNESDLIQHDLECINWSDYFRLSFKDSKFPSEKNKLSTKTWTCQLCKKQFDQRIDLSKHQCIELNLKLLKKKKELRKKKWKETHWKRKIDLSHIETTSLTQLSSNICDNLTFCIDGTLQDMKSYSKEVKDYLNTELGNESQIQMILKCCFPEVYQQITKDIPNLNEANASRLIEEHLNKKSSLYFTNDLTCKKCHEKFVKLGDYIDHQKIHPNSDLKISSDSPIGYLACDPIGYLLNIHWDNTTFVKCDKCELEFTRGDFKKHSHDEEGLKISKEILDDLVNGLNLNRRKRTVNEIILNDEKPKSKRTNRKSNLSISSSSECQTPIKKEVIQENIDVPIISTTRTSSRHKIKTEMSSPEVTPSKKELKSEFMSVKIVNNRKVHICDKCNLEFTSGNSVSRHQEKSCLRLKVINIEAKSKTKNKPGEVKKKCPICGFIFTNTHQLSIHIYRQHKGLLGNAHDPPLAEAKHFNDDIVKREEEFDDEDDVENNEVDLDSHDLNDDTSWILHESTTDEATINSSIESPNKKRKILNSTI
ncbi:unnamed protein product [Brachionus calyciflorus]|uniref:Uncharacterized protein n=1 Tax=Brachionus calyciflorus TaxID=104777 RepID=A0A813XSH5_9BILA|nr:unnamed protein product [Brachionus calyciflorus]